MRKANRAHGWPGFRALVGAWLTAGLWACSAPVEAWTVLGVVTRVSDGDTVTVTDRTRQVHKIRLAGIDAPEVQQPDGQKAGGALRSALMRRAVRAECHKVDRYGRGICKLFVEQQDLGLLMLRAGLAWHYVDHIRDQPPDEAQRYARAEKEARAAGRGLWARRAPMPPWEWRRAKARESARQRALADGGRTL